MQPYRVSVRQRPRLLASLFAGAGALFGPRAASAAGQPDIVILILNDARDGDQTAMPQTMDWLAGDGTTFPNAFLTTPLCCPSRASILTGLYPHNHGVYDNRAGQHGGWEGFARQGNRGRALGVLLQQAGYFTAAVGAYLNGSQPGTGIEPGWDIGPGGGGQRKKGGKGGGKGKRRRRRNRGEGQQPQTATAAIAAAPLDKPLLLHVGFGAPHVPAIPLPPYAGRYAGATVERDPSFNEEDVGDKPRYVAGLRRLSGGEMAWVDDLHRRRLETLLQVDDDIAAIRSALAARGRLDNTYVFLLTDNGYLLGHHRLYGKMAPYDGSIRFPLFAFGPRFSPGAVDQRLVGNIDLAPTCCELAGAGVPSMDGHSFLSGNARDAMLIELLGSDLQSMDWPGDRAEVPRYSALRTADHLYVEYQGGGRELYDHRRDPFETRNLLAGPVSPEDAALAAQLSSRLGSLRG